MNHALQIFRFKPTIELDPATPIVSATLSTPGSTSPTNLTITPPSTIEPPSPFPTPGMYVLNVKTDCGCNEGLVYIPCEPAAANPIPRPNLDQPTITECCPTPPAPAPAPPPPTP